MTEHASVGFLSDGVPYLKIGQGPPLVIVQGLTPSNDVPTWWERRMAVTYGTPLARHFTVYSVNRKRGLSPGESMSDIARHLVNAIEHDVGQPVFLQGSSTGGSVVQLAADRPDLVRRLVVVSSACRLGPGGRAVQAEVARMTRAGDAADAWAHLMASLMLPPVLRGPLRAVARLAVRPMVADDPTDLLVTLDAEDAFDIEADLPRITAPTLVIGGSKDVLYSRELFEATARGVKDGRAHVFEGWGHMRTSGSRAAACLALGFMLAG